MATHEGLPATITEYLDVWCGDLLEGLNAQVRSALIRSAESLCLGWLPWPSRLQVQRLAEVARGDICEDARQGELLEAFAGGARGALERLRVAPVRAAVVRELGQLQPTPSMMNQVTGAYRRGELSREEYCEVLGRALRLPHLPPPRPLPSSLPPIPVGYCGQRVSADGHSPAMAARPLRVVPAMVSYQPQRFVTDGSQQPGTLPEGQAVQGGGGMGYQLRTVDWFLQSRGWVRWGEEWNGSGWVWPPSEGGSWRQPTTIDFTGGSLRVRLACVGPTGVRRSQMLSGESELRREIATIEEWTDQGRAA